MKYSLANHLKKPFRIFLKIIRIGHLGSFVIYKINILNYYGLILYMSLIYFKKGFQRIYENSVDKN